jgi:anti-sigma regulatory factor (Ser/Thr protein kinase)
MALNGSYLQIAAVLTQVPVACDFVAAEAMRAGLDEHAIYHCQLAVDEACTNIIEHGYRRRKDSPVIDIFCNTDSYRFTITILDDGIMFNPLVQPDPDSTAPLEQRGRGGWGIHFIKKFMDEVVYSRENQRNCLSLTKFRPVGSV